MRHCVTNMVLTTPLLAYNHAHADMCAIMPVGGKRPGAGRKPGAAWAGKTPREPAIRSMAKSRVRQILETKNDPVAVLVDIANDTNVDVALRVQAATAAAPFMFPRLSAAVVSVAPQTAKHDSERLIERLMTRFQRLAGPTIEAQPIQVIEECA